MLCGDDIMETQPVIVVLNKYCTPFDGIAFILFAQEKVTTVCTDFDQNIIRGLLVSAFQNSGLYSSIGGRHLLIKAPMYFLPNWNNSVLRPLLLKR